MSKVKIFSIYYSKQNLFHGKAIKTDIIEPIQTGKAATGWDLGMLSDDTGDNISSKNPYYGELTCWYWVWKNWLPQHPECEYIGFTQYRRMLQLGDDRKRPVAGGYLKSVFQRTFEKICLSYNEQLVWETITKYDYILPYKWQDCIANPCRRFCILENEEIYRIARDVILRGKKECEKKVFDNCMIMNEGHYKPAFVMRVTLFQEFIEWVFDFCNALDCELQLNKVELTPRVFAYCIEYFMNYWVFLKQYDSSVKIQKTFLYEARFYKKMFCDKVKLIDKKRKVSNKYNELISI